MQRDLACAWRQLTRNRGLAAAIVVPLAVALGLSAAVLTIADAMLVKALPYPAPDRLVRVDGVFTRLPLRMNESGLELTAPLDAPELSSAASFAAVGMYAVAGLNAGGDRPERLRAAAVTGGFFDALQVPPRLGRVFTNADAASASRVAVVSAHLWRARFQSDAGVIGRTVHLNGQPFAIVAVMPDTFDFPERTDVWIPAGSDMQVATQVAVPSFIARLQRGATAASARSELLRIVSDGALTRQDARRPTVRVTVLRDALVEPVRPALWFVACAGLLLLVVASLNSANLMVASVYDRRRDFAVRRAIGATTAGVLRPVLYESLLIVSASAACAVPVGAGAMNAVRVLVPASLLPSAALDPTARALSILMLLSSATAVLFACMPLFAALSSGAAPARLELPSAAPKRRASGAVVIAQVASALVVVACAMTIVGGIRRLQSIDLGARHDDAVVAEITLPAVAYPDSARHGVFFDRLRQELRATPGVIAAGITNHLPGTDVITPAIPLRVDAAAPTAAPAAVLRLAATPGYFSALGIDLVAGRTFTDDDRAGSPAVVVVSTACARAMGLPPGAALGRRVNVGLDPGHWATIVGVVRDVRMKGPESETSAALYVPLAQSSAGATAFVAVNGTAGRSVLVTAIRRAIGRLDSGLPVYNVREFGEIRAEYLATRRFAMTLGLAFGAIVIAVSCLGLNAIVMYMVRRRTREIGVRLAIGATPFAVRRAVMQTGAGYAAAGVAIGLAVLPFVARLLVSAIPGIVAPGAMAVAALAAIVFTITTLAVWIPAARAARVDPMTALRAE